MYMTIREGRDVLLVTLTDGIVVIETGVPLMENVIDPGAEQAGDFQFKELGEFIGEKCKKSINEKNKDHHPFKNRIYTEKPNSPQLLFNQTLERLRSHFFLLR